MIDVQFPRIVDLLEAWRLHSMGVHAEDIDDSVSYEAATTFRRLAALGLVPNAIPVMGTILRLLAEQGHVNCSVPSLLSIAEADLKYSNVEFPFTAFSASQFSRRRSESIRLRLRAIGINCQISIGPRGADHKISIHMLEANSATQEIALASKTQDDSFNSKLLDIFRAPVTKASAQVEAIKSAADSWQSTVEGLVMARAARLMGTSLPGDAEEKSRNALSDLLAAVEAVDGMPELMREMLGASTPTPALAPVRAAPSTSSPSSPLSGDSAAMEPDPAVPQPPRPLALATSIHDRAMIDLKPRRWPKTTKASETKPVLVVSVEKAAQATEMVMRSEAVQWTWDLISVVRDAEVIAARIKSGKYSGVVVFIHSINLQSGAISIIRSACESSRTPFTSAPKQGTGSTANALETIESELKKAST